MLGRLSARRHVLVSRSPSERLSRRSMTKARTTFRPRPFLSPQNRRPRSSDLITRLQPCPRVAAFPARYLYSPQTQDGLGGALPPAWALRGHVVDLDLAVLWPGHPRHEITAALPRLVRRRVALNGAPRIDERPEMFLEASGLGWAQSIRDRLTDGASVWVR
jgi:hypothetical protein